MRVLFAPAPMSAHITLMVPIAWALQTAGHEVRVAVPPNFADNVTAAGLTPAPVGESVDLMAALAKSDPADILALSGLHSRGTPRADMMRFRITWLTAFYFGPEMPVGSMRHSVDELVAFARGWDADLVISGYFHGAVAARACGATNVRMLTGLDQIGRMRSDFLQQRADGASEDNVAEMLDSTLKRFGCSFDEEIITGQWTLDPMPQAMRLPLNSPSIPMRQIPINPPATPPEWLREPVKQPRVCLTLGLSGREAYGEHSAAADFLTAAADLDIEVVATLTADQIPPDVTVPGNVRLVDFVPLNVLLPTCAAIVHHGGYLTAFAAVPHGVPQIVVPAAVWDESEVATYLQDRGAGIALAPEGTTPEQFAGAVRRVLSDRGFADGAKRVHSDLLAMPTPNEVVPTLERLTTRNG